MSEEKNDEIRLSDNYSLESLEATERASIDSMIATAKTYPRNIKRAVSNSIAVVTLNVESAKVCSYALPRGGSQIIGPSVHLARILAQNFQNLRVESKVIDITATQIVSQATCLDLENNYGVRVEVRRSIMGKASGRFNDDMITVTGNATNAIAYRNAVLAVIPKPIIDTVYQAAQNTITGDISDEQKLITRRKELIDQFMADYGATEAEILTLVGKGAVEGIKRDEIVFLIGIRQAIKDGDTTIDLVFGRDQTTQKATDKLKEVAQKAYQKIEEKADKKAKGQQNQSQQNQAGPAGAGTINFDGNKQK